VNDMVILGIETSCDDTGVALVQGGRRILANVVQSQVAVHREFGGVVPEVASRKHIANIGVVLEECMERSGLGLNEVDVIAVTNRPGLIGALLVGVSFAKGLAYALGKPLLAINHLEGHIYANFLEHEGIEFPLVCLIVSGGHTSLVYMRNHGVMEVMGQTRDDAAGEAFDKISRFLGLGYPGGPAIEKAARLGREGVYQLPRAYLEKDGFEFSFSGLKTATMNLWNRLKKSGQEVDVNHLAAEFQAAVVDVLVEKTIAAARHRGVRTVLLAGGVAANTRLRERMSEGCREIGLNLFYPSIALCTDNAAMIAACAAYRWGLDSPAPLQLNAYPGL